MVIYFLGEDYIKVNKQITSLNIIIKWVCFLELLHAFTLYDFDGFWTDDLINCQEDHATIEGWDSHGLALDDVLESDGVVVDQVILVPLIARGHGEIHGGGLGTFIGEGNEKIGSFLTGLLMTLTFESVGVRGIHTRFDFYLFVHDLTSS